MANEERKGDPGKTAKHLVGTSRGGRSAELRASEARAKCARRVDPEVSEGEGCDVPKDRPVYLPVMFSPFFYTYALSSYPYPTQQGFSCECIVHVPHHQKIRHEKTAKSSELFLYACPVDCPGSSSELDENVTNTTRPNSSSVRCSQ